MLEEVLERMLKGMLKEVLERMLRKILGVINVELIDVLLRKEFLEEVIERKSIKLEERERIKEIP